MLDLTLRRLPHPSLIPGESGYGTSSRLIALSEHLPHLVKASVMRELRLSTTYVDLDIKVSCPKVKNSSVCAAAAPQLARRYVASVAMPPAGTTYIGKSPTGASHGFLDLAVPV